MKEGSKIHFVDSAHANRHKNQKAKIKKKVKSYQRKLENINQKNCNGCMIQDTDNSKRTNR